MNAALHIHPMYPFGGMTRLPDLWQAVFRSFFPAPTPQFRRAEAERLLAPDWERQLSNLMTSIHPIDLDGHYRGARFTTSRTRREATMSGDWNDIHLNPDLPHREFGKLIAHGWGGITQVLGALRHRTSGMRIRPATLVAEFRGPAFVDKDRLHQVTITPPGAQPNDYRAEAFTDPQAKPILCITCTMTAAARGQSLGDEALEWHLPLMAGWQISALLAKTWPGCLYYRQALSLGAIHQKECSTLHTSVRGLGRNEKGHTVVRTEVTDGQHSIARGEAIIIT